MASRTSERGELEKWAHRRGENLGQVSGLDVRGENQIRQGDRIAIKKRASTPKMIEIRALGIITGARAKNQRVGVDWLKIGLRHKVGIRGFVGTISGPFSLDEDHRREWVRRVFLLDRFEHLLGPEMLDVDEEAVLAQEGGRKLRLHCKRRLRAEEAVYRFWYFFPSRSVVW